MAERRGASAIPFNKAGNTELYSVSWHDRLLYGFENFQNDGVQLHPTSLNLVPSG